MAYRVELTQEARTHLDGRQIRRAKSRIVREINAQLPHEPLVETTNRFEMQPNSLATWELRVQPYRVYYDVDEEAGMVWVRAVGVKIRDKVYIGGKETNLRE